MPTCWMADEATSMPSLSSIRWRPWKRLEYRALGRAIIAPNLMCKPATVLITKVTIKGAAQAVQMFGPAQAAVARAVTDSVAAGVIPKDQAENLVIVCGVFIHWQAKDDTKIYQYNYD